MNSGSSNNGARPDEKPKIRAATVWLDGCSGCHMSFLDIDERLITLTQYVQMVYTPLIDLKEYPESVDVALIEGAVSSEEDLHKIQMVRARTKTLIALGDCCVTGNVPAMRNPFGIKAITQRGYFETATLQAQTPNRVVPPLLARVRPVHEVVKVDIFVPGCPPSADTIWFVLTELLEGRTPDLQTRARFGA